MAGQPQLRAGGGAVRERGATGVASPRDVGQQLAGAPGRVNNLVLTLRPRSLPAVQRELQAALAAVRPPVSATISTRAGIPSYRMLYDDIKGDAELWRAIAILLLAGTAFAALNLTTRVVEAQRREIGIGMALGVRPPLLAVRPLLFAALSVGRLAGGLVLSREAAADLGAGVGSVVTFRQPQAVGGGLRTADSPVRVAGIDPSPMRVYAYLDSATAAPLFGLVGLSARADLVVVGRHAKHPGLPGAGSVRHAVLNHAHGPVAIVPSA